MIRRFSALVLCLATLLACEADGAAIDASVQNSIETRIIVDKTAFNRWKTDFTSSSTPDTQRNDQTIAQLTKYIKSVIVGVNAIYKELIRVGIKLDMRIADIKFIKDETISTNVYDGNKVSGDRVLQTFGEFLRRKNYPATDHTVLLTGLDLSNGNSNNVLGVAYTETMCQERVSLSAVEAQRNGNVVLSLAHEVGHSLGARHDGDGNSCSENSMQVMDGSRDLNSTKNFRFSTCSITYFRTTLQSLQDRNGGSCLSASKTSKPEVQGRQLGQEFDPDTICQMSNGKQSAFGRVFYGPSANVPYSTVCTAIWCLRENSYYNSVVGTDGFTCGRGKVCSLGVCQNSPTATPIVSDSCLYGDMPSHVIITDNKNCQQLVGGQDKSACYSPLIARSCCRTCQATGPAECEYGDKAYWCSTLPCPVGCYANDKACCASCKKYETSISDCKYGDKNDQCANFIASNPAACGVNKDVCCGSCARQTSGRQLAESESGTTVLPDLTTLNGTSTDPATNNAAPRCRDRSFGCVIRILVFGLHDLCDNQAILATCCETCSVIKTQRDGK